MDKMDHNESESELPTELPDFKLNEQEVPSVRIKSIHLQNYKVFDDYYLDFTRTEGIKPFACFFGPNGSGKTTILDSIQMLFGRYDSYSEDRLIQLLRKSVRHHGRDLVSEGSDFLLTAEIESSLGDYEIRMNKMGFITDHPDEIKWIIYRLCFYARFDMDIVRGFQLPRNKWEIFKDLFMSVTGFEIEERTTLFDQAGDDRQARLLDKYVLEFTVHKPDESISSKECSAGERKVIKSFSTLLNNQYIPQILLVDNVAMHVESGRHLNLVRSMKRCFPKSQIFATTHSYQISRNFGERDELYDLRLVKASNIIKQQPWRLYMADELNDCLAKLDCMISSKDIVNEEIGNGKKILNRCFEDISDINLIENCEKFMKKTSQLFVNDTVAYFSKNN